MWVDPSLEKIDAVFVNVRAWTGSVDDPAEHAVFEKHRFAAAPSDLVKLATFELRFSNIYSALCCETANIFSPPQSD